MTALPITRTDTLAENTYYPDTGCRTADAVMANGQKSSCLDCPFTGACKHDDPIWMEHQTRAKRDIEIARRHKNGESAVDLSPEYGISTRTIHRIIQHQRDGRVVERTEENDGQLLTLEQLADKVLYKRPEPHPQFVPSGFDDSVEDVP